MRHWNYPDKNTLIGDLDVGAAGIVDAGVVVRDGGRISGRLSVIIDGESWEMPTPF